MHIRDGEVIKTIIKRHPTPYIFRIVQAALVISPIYFVIYIIAREISTRALLITLSVFSVIVFIVFIILSLDYLLDKLVITNRRVLSIDWKSLLSKVEHEVLLDDIQDIKTSELGVLANFFVFNYGTIQLESSASTISVIYTQCRDPDKVKHIILGLVEELKNDSHLE